MLIDTTPEQLALDNSRRTAEQERLRSDFLNEFLQDLHEMDDTVILRFEDGRTLLRLKAAFEANGQGPQRS